MAQSRSAPGLVAFILASVFAVEAVAQTATVLSTSNAITAASSTVASASASTASTSSDIPLSLVGIAESLLSSYYPSTSLGASNIATLTFPSVVVIDSTTYTVDSGSTTTSVLAEATDTADHHVSSHHGLDSDAKIGIAVGCAVGGIAIVVLAIVFCCLYRRKRRTGAYFVRRPTPSVADSDMEAWRSPQRPEASLLSSGPSREWTEKHPRDSIRPSSATAPQMAAQELMQAPPMAMHPAFARQHSHYSGHSSSEESHFYTPPEQRSEQYELEGEESAAPSHQELDTEEFSRDRGSSGETGVAAVRPPTPMNPFMAMMSGANQHPEAGTRQNQKNPFMSPEDEEEEERDLVSPIVPIRNPERRYSPMVHYPSWGEVSEFDFSEDGGEQPLRERASYESSGDGWHPTQNSAYGR